MEVITTDELQKRLKISRFTVWKWRKDGILPEPIHLGTRSIRWDWEAIVLILKSRKSKKYGRPNVRQN